MRHAVGLGLIVALTASCGPALAQAVAPPAKGTIVGDLLHSLPPDPPDASAPKTAASATDPQTEWRTYLSGDWSATFETMTVGDQTTTYNKATYQGDEFRIASHFMIKLRTVDIVVVGRYTVVQAPGDGSKATISYSIVDWSPKKLCGDRCMPIPKPKDQTETLERVDADTLQDGEGHAWHRG